MRQPKIGEDQPPILVQEHVVWLEIQMRDVSGMGIAHRRAHLRQDAFDLGQRQRRRALFEQIIEGAPLVKRHHQVEYGALFPHFQYRQNVGMLQCCQGACLTQKALALVGIVKVALQQQLDGTLLLKQLVVGLIDFSKAAHA